MKKKIQELLEKAIKRSQETGKLPRTTGFDIQIDEEMDASKVEKHGDFSSNIAMVMASVMKTSPRIIAGEIVSSLEDTYGIVEKAEVAGPGFINIRVKLSGWIPLLRVIHREKQRYGASDSGQNEPVQVEFVSSNPTGPLHFGHGRGAAVGDSIANILAFVGYSVQREYYINDSGRQINTLGKSVFARYKELYGKDSGFPEDGYLGEYIGELAEEIRNDRKDELFDMDETEAISFCAEFACRRIIGWIREDLKDFDVSYDRWFSEKELHESGKVDEVLNSFEKSGIVYEKEGARWFKSSEFGDEKDRVVIRQNGETTYFASDIAYHMDKFERGLEKVIDVWGADHHGYIPRMKAAVVASGRRSSQFDVVLVNLVNLLRGGKPAAMSTRAGEFVTLKDVIRDVGRDSARFIFLTRHYESPLDFDLELAKKQTNENPVYYVQYVHARISSILEKGKERGITLGHTKDVSDATLEQLKASEEIALIKAMARFPDVVKYSAKFLEPHRITYYLIDLASSFHTYYNKHRVLVDEPELLTARLYLVTAVQIVIKTGLNLLGVSAPDKM